MTDLFEKHRKIFGPVSFVIRGGSAAAYSDYHATGLNPAGNACLTDLAFVAGRFRIVQSKRML